MHGPAPVGRAPLRLPDVPLTKLFDAAPQRRIPFGLAGAQGLIGIEQLPVEQQQLVRAAARRSAITAPFRPASGPAASPSRRMPGCSR